MNVFEEVKDAGTIGISGHVRPDGDCVGAVMGLYLYLKKVCPQARIQVFLEEPSRIFSCIAGVEDIHTDFQTDIESFDVFFALDTVKDRMAEAEKYYDGARKRINIDHHVSNPGCGDVNYIRPDASSTCELVYEVLEDKSLMDQEIAKALYIGIIHDTGVLQYSNTAPATLRVVAELISYGFDFPRLIEETFYEKTHIQNQILGRALLESALIMDGKCVVSVIDKKIMDHYGASSHDLEGIVSQLRNTQGVECAIFLHETNALEYKVSLRSGGMVDVAKVAVCFGGGGHVRAAGVTMQGTSQDIVERLSAQIAKQF